MYCIIHLLFILSFNNNAFGKIVLPYLLLDSDLMSENITDSDMSFFPFLMLIGSKMDTSEYWRETEILSLIRNREASIDYDKCEQTAQDNSIVEFPSRRTVRPVCRSKTDRQMCPQCPLFNNYAECELFRESCSERRVHPSEFRTYCDQKYGNWKAMFLPADYAQCRCCDECIFFRELDQSCQHDEYIFDVDEFLPVTTIDFRAGCNPYWGHPEQEFKALRCDKVLRRCVPVTIPPLPNETLNIRRSYRYQPATGGADCPTSCRGYDCYGDLVKEEECTLGAYLPDKEQCNCCGRCSAYQQLNQKCAEFKKTVHKVNGSNEIEVEEEFLEPGCDDGLVCRQGLCQDIHIVESTLGIRTRRDDRIRIANEPCKQELKYFKKKYGEFGYLHYEAPQCTPLWLYAPIQCRRFVCYCALEDGTFIEGIKVPRVEVSNMNCDCAREKCRTGSDIECDGFGNYIGAVFTPDVGKRSNNIALHDPATLVLPVLIIACDRVTVKRCLDNLIKFRPNKETFPLIVSQDCGHNATYQVIKSFVDLDPTISVVSQPDLSEIQLPKAEVMFRGYYNIARHHKFALNYVLKTMGHDAVIIVEDDLDISPDFFEYFLGTYPLLYKDPSLWCISAWNDNGRKDVIDMSRPDLLHRTDFFPGLGWMLRRQTWLDLEQRWPVGFFDDWLRDPQNVGHKACIRPEISRTYSFGKIGVSKGLYYDKHLLNMQLNSVYVEFTKLDLSYLLKDNYDETLATTVDALPELTASNALTYDNGDVRVSYADAATFRRNAEKLGLMDDFRSGVPRTAYRGVVTCYVRGRRVYLVPGYHWTQYDPSW